MAGLAGASSSGPNSALQMIGQLDEKHPIHGHVANLFQGLLPSALSQQYRQQLFEYIVQLIKRTSPAAIPFLYGSFPLNTYLPSGDLDVGVAITPDQVTPFFTHLKRFLLSLEAQGNNGVVMPFPVRFHTYINAAEIKLLKSFVGNIVVDISANTLGALAGVCFLEEVDREVGRNHLLKRSFLLVKAWCMYESRILASHHSLLSSYALQVLVLHIINVYSDFARTPVQVLASFLAVYSRFDWARWAVTVRGRVPLQQLPVGGVKLTHTGAPDLDAGVPVLSNTFLERCLKRYGRENQGSGEGHGKGKHAKYARPQRVFGTKHMNIVDPLDAPNNLGRSVNFGNFRRIRNCFSRGHAQFSHVLRSALGYGESASPDMSTEEEEELTVEELLAQSRRRRAEWRRVLPKGSVAGCVPSNTLEEAGDVTTGQGTMSVVLRKFFAHSWRRFEGNHRPDTLAGRCSCEVKSQSEPAGDSDGVDRIESGGAVDSPPSQPVVHERGCPMFVRGMPSRFDPFASDLDSLRQQLERLSALSHMDLHKHRAHSQGARKDRRGGWHRQSQVRGQRASAGGWSHAQQHAQIQAQRRAAQRAPVQPTQEAQQLAQIPQPQSHRLRGANPGQAGRWGLNVGSPAAVATVGAPVRQAYPSGLGKNGGGAQARILQAQANAQVQSLYTRTAQGGLPAGPPDHTPVSVVSPTAATQSPPLRSTPSTAQSVRPLEAMSAPASPTSGRALWWTRRSAGERERERKGEAGVSPSLSDWRSKGPVAGGGRKDSVASDDSPGVVAVSTASSPWGSATPPLLPPPPPSLSTAPTQLPRAVSQPQELSQPSTASVTSGSETPSGSQGPTLRPHLPGSAWGSQSISWASVLGKEAEAGKRPDRTVLRPEKRSSAPSAARQAARAIGRIVRGRQRKGSKSGDARPNRSNNPRLRRVLPVQTSEEPLSQTQSAEAGGGTASAGSITHASPVQAPSLWPALRTGSAVVRSASSSPARPSVWENARVLSWSTPNASATPPGANRESSLAHPSKEARPVSAEEQNVLSVEEPRHPRAREPGEREVPMVPRPDAHAPPPSSIAVMSAATSTAAGSAGRETARSRHVSNSLSIWGSTRVERLRQKLNSGDIQKGGLSSLMAESTGGGHAVSTSSADAIQGPGPAPSDSADGDGDSQTDATDEAWHQVGPRSRRRSERRDSGEAGGKGGAGRPSSTWGYGHGSARSAVHYGSEHETRVGGRGSSRKDGMSERGSWANSWRANPRRAVAKDTSKDKTK